MALPPDQRLLAGDLCAKLAEAADAESLAATAGRILRSLLRRAGDVEFLAVVEDMLIDGIAGRPLEDQKALACQVVELVIEKRPEVAVAWQALHGVPQAAPAQRREADRVVAEARPPAPAAAVPPPPPVPAPVSYDFAAAEDQVGSYVSEVLERRLHMFLVEDQPFPSVAYRHERPFFLFDRAFAGVVRRFVTEALVVQCRDALQRHVYKQIRPRLLLDEVQLKAFLAEKRMDIWKILIERLTKLAGHHRTAEDKLAAAEAGEGGGADEFSEVEIPITQDRVFRVLGVEFTLGRKTTKRRMRVRVKATTEPSADELEALSLITRFRNIAAEAGMELPGQCDFLFLRTLLEFDAKKYSQAIKEFVGLARHSETSRQFLFERLGAIDEAYANTLSDALILIMFHQANDNFGFQEVFDLCIGTSLQRDAMAKRRPFLQEEVGRRPRELAFQIREALRRRYDEETVEVAVAQLLSVCRILPRGRFEPEFKAAQGVFQAFPMAFSGDPDEPVFSHIGHILHRAVAAQDIDVAATVDSVRHVYAPLAERLRSSVRKG